MRPLQVADAETIVLGLQDEIRRSEESRYDHRLHGVLLVAQGMTCPEVSRLLGDAPRSVEYWVRRFEERGLGGLVEGRVLRQTPRDLGLTGTLWDGKTLSAWIEQRFQVRLRVRQCQRLFRQRGFRLRKPRPLIAHADPERQKTHKKTPGVKR